MAGARRLAAGPLGTGRAGVDPGVPAPGASDLSGERGAAQVTRPGPRDPVSTLRPRPRSSARPGDPQAGCCAGGGGGLLDVKRAQSGGGGARWQGEPGMSRGERRAQNPEPGLPESAGVGSSFVALGKSTSLSVPQFP